MKKVMMTLVAALMTVAASAQVYVGGSLGIGSVKLGANDAKTSFKIVPEVGYNINDEWAVGLAIGYQQGECSLGKGEYMQDTEMKMFGVNPYVRNTFLHTKYVNVFVDGGLTYENIKDFGNNFQVGLKPGIAVNFNDKLSFVAHIGFIGYETFSPKGDGKSSNTVGVDLDGNNITFGLYYNF
jgi:hypothetical protein